MSLKHLNVTHHTSIADKLLIMADMPYTHLETLKVSLNMYSADVLRVGIRISTVNGDKFYTCQSSEKKYEIFESNKEHYEEIVKEAKEVARTFSRDRCNIHVRSNTLKKFMLSVVRNFINPLILNLSS
jgi:hypothetical protein